MKETARRHGLPNGKSQREVGWKQAGSPEGEGGKCLCGVRKLAGKLSLKIFTGLKLLDLTGLRHENAANDVRFCGKICQEMELALPGSVWKQLMRICGMKKW
jgi:hypothetical protein